MQITAQGYNKLDSLLDEYTQFELNLSAQDGAGQPVTVECSYTLEEIWNLEGDNLFRAIYPTVKNDIINLFNSGKVKNIKAIDLLTYTTYNAPARPPDSQPSLPDTIEVEDPILFKGPLEHAEGKRKLQELEAGYRVSCLGENIAELRDQINTITKAKWSFKLFEVEQERSVVSIFLSCQNIDDFTNRVSALMNLITWMNKDAMHQILKSEIDEKEGTTVHLEKFLEQEFVVYDKQNAFGRFKSLQTLLKDFMTHKETEEIVTGFREFGIPWPEKDYSATWEGVLYKYASFLKSLLQIMKSK